MVSLWPSVAYPNWPVHPPAHCRGSDSEVGCDRNIPKVIPTVVKPREYQVTAAGVVSRYRASFEIAYLFFRGVHDEEAVKCSAKQENRDRRLEGFLTRHHASSERATKYSIYLGRVVPG